jgi:hypothetical protein
MAVKNAEENVLSLSFVDDVTWVATGVNADEVTHKLDRCAERALEWAKENAAQFGPGKI